MTIVRQIVDTTEGQIKTARSLVRRSWLVSLGAAGMAVDTTESTFNKFVRRGEKVAQATRKDLKKLNARLRREQRELQHDVQDAEQNIEQRLTDVVAAFNIPTRRDLRVLDARISQLNTQLHDLNVGETSVVEFPISSYDTLTADEINALVRRDQASVGQQTSSSMPSGSRKNSDHSSPNRWMSPTSWAPASTRRPLTTSSMARESTARA